MVYLPPLVLSWALGSDFSFSRFATADKSAARIQLVTRLSNTRLKLPAPVPTESGSRPERRCASIPFVNTPARRRSLSAIR
jgi:hypothetical protein